MNLLIHDYLIRARSKFNLSQKDMAKLIKINEKKYIKLEQGEVEPNMKLFKKICNLVTRKTIIMLRLENNLSIDQLCLKLDIEKNNYNKYEKGKGDISLETLYKLADFYKVSSDYILGLEE